MTHLPDTKRILMKLDRMEEKMVDTGQIHRAALMAAIEEEGLVIVPKDKLREALQEAYDQTGACVWPMCQGMDSDGGCEGGEPIKIPHITPDDDCPLAGEE